MKMITRIPSAIYSLFFATVLELKTLFEFKSLVRLVLLFACAAWLGVAVDAQETMRPDKANFLPPATGEALTLTPTDMPDVSCSVVEWKGDPAVPALAVICPPQDTFAPLHIYLRLSWLKPEDVPVIARRITASARSLTKIRTKDSTAWAWLEVREKYNTTRRKWVAFNGLLDMALLTLHPKR